jgi:DHA2 family multidrug resistance protein
MNSQQSGQPAGEGARALRFAALLATYMQSANLPVPNAVLRLIQGSLSMTDDQAGWIFTSYLAASAITLPVAQWLAGRYGLKLVYQTALAFFALGLLLATLATTPLEFVGARIIQGLASGVLAPLSMAISMETLPLEKRASLARRGPPSCCSASSAGRASVAGSANISAGGRSSTSACRCRRTSSW